MEAKRSERRKMLTEEEKKRVKYLYGVGWSYQEITQDMVDGRNNQLSQAILKEVEKCCVYEVIKE